MRRVILTLVVTVAVLVLLLGYKTTSLKSLPTVAIAPTSSSTGKAGTTKGAKTIDGAVGQTQFRPVQGRGTIKGGKLTQLLPVQTPIRHTRRRGTAPAHGSARCWGRPPHSSHRPRGTSTSTPAGGSTHPAT